MISCRKQAWFVHIYTARHISFYWWGSQTTTSSWGSWHWIVHQNSFLLKTVVFTGNNQLYTSFAVASSICNIKLASTSPSWEIVQQYQPQKLWELEGTVSSQMVKWASQNNGLQMKNKIMHRHLASSMLHSLHFPKCLNKQCSLSKDSPGQFLGTFLEMTVQDKMS